MIAGSLTLLAIAYVAGAWRVWARAGPGHGLSTAHVGWFALGWITLGLALESPLHEWSERLLSAHMIQHELLMIVAAPLLAASRVGYAVSWTLPGGWRRRLGRAWHGVPGRTLRPLTVPVIAFAAHLLARLAWHVPRLYVAALADPWVHALQHATFLGTAWWFWSGVVRAESRHGGHGAGVVMVFALGTLSGLLGALMAVSNRVWYGPYAAKAAGWWTALDDQQLAGLLMWVPAGLGFSAAALLCVQRWLHYAGSRRRWSDEAAASPPPAP
jgi:cytochrome c oxidase assembly factor CtaG